MKWMEEVEVVLLFSLLLCLVSVFFSPSSIRPRFHLSGFRNLLYYPTLVFFFFSFSLPFLGKKKKKTKTKVGVICGVTIDNVRSARALAKQENLILILFIFLLSNLLFLFFRFLLLLCDLTVDCT